MSKNSSCSSCGSNRKSAISLAVLLSVTGLLGSGLTALQASTFNVGVTVDASGPTDSLPHIWNGVMGDLSTILTPEGKRLLERVSSVSRHPYYRRTMGGLNSGIGFPSSTNVYHEDENGRPFYDFTLFDQIYDTIEASGMVPFVCLSFMPLELSSAPPDSLRRSGDRPDRYPPADYAKWSDFIGALARHCVERYGRDRVASWKWEMWNEPDLNYYWHADREAFFKLYDYTVSAIKKILPEAAVGGNAVAGAGSSFLDEFIQHCLEGTNYVTGRQGTPLDFISFHIKGGGSRAEGNLTSPELLRRANLKPRNPNFSGMIERTESTLERIGSIPGTEGLPVYITECDVDFGVGNSVYRDPNARYRNNEYFATFQCALAARMLGLADKFPANPIRGINMDTFYFSGRRVFEGQRTLFTAGGIDKPVFNALRLLGKLGDRKLDLSREGGSPDAVGGLAVRGPEGQIQVMLYNFEQDQHYGDTVQVELTVTGAGNSPLELTHWRIDREHSNSYRVWQAMGSPLHPTAEQLAEIHRRMGLETTGPVRTLKPRDGRLVLNVTLPPHGVSLLEIR